MTLSLDSAYLRRLAWIGAAKGPRVWLRASPPPIGVAAAIAAPDQRRHIRHNLRELVGPRSAWREGIDVVRTFVTFAQSFAESLSLTGPHPSEPSLRVFGAEHLQRVVGEGNGLVLGTAHTAGWEAALMALEKSSDVPVLVVMRPEREGAARAYHPVAGGSPRRRVVAAEDDAMSSLPLLRHVRSGGAVAVQVDRCPEGKRSIPVQAGRKRWVLPAGPFGLAAASGAPLVLALCSRTGFLSYDLRIEPPIAVGRGEPAQARAAEKVARALARHVQAAPTQWFDFRPA